MNEDKNTLQFSSEMVLQALCQNTLDHSMVPICIYTIAKYTGLTIGQIIDAVEFLVDINAMVFLGVNEAFNLRSDLYDQSPLYHCLLRPGSYQSYIALQRNKKEELCLG